MSADSSSKSDQEMELPTTKVRSYMPISDPERVESFLDPVRRAILVALRYGADDTRIEKETETVKQENGTQVTTTVERVIPIKRSWMTVPEIVNAIQDFLPEIKVSKYNCYYHLPKLREQGLVEQYPLPEFDSTGNEVSSKRGVYYRRTAKVFVVSGSKMSGDIVESYMKLFEGGFEVEMSKNKKKEVEDLLSKQIEMIDDTMEYLAVHLKEVEIDSTALNELLYGMSLVFLSDNDEFIKTQKRLKAAVLTPCCGAETDLLAVCSYCGEEIEPDSVITKYIDGKAVTFCSEECANCYTERL